MRLCLVLVLATSIAVSIAHAAIINVPADQPTIQAGINAASNGDSVLVAPGTYTENINFMGKAITVTSSAGAETTIIDGGNTAPVATFSSSEGPMSVLSHSLYRTAPQPSIVKTLVEAFILMDHPRPSPTILSKRTPLAMMAAGSESRSGRRLSRTISSKTIFNWAAKAVREVEESRSLERDPHRSSGTGFRTMFGRVTVAGLLCSRLEPRPS